MSIHDDLTAVAQWLARDYGWAARAFASARAMECLYYADEAGQERWQRVEWMLSHGVVHQAGASRVA